MATLTATIQADADDGHVSFGDLSTGPILGTDYGDTAARTFFRFAGVTIPAGSTISSAILTLTRVFADTGDLSVAFKGHNVDNSPAFTTTALVTGAALTTASTALTSTSAAWNAGGTQTVDVTSSVAAVIGRAGWTSGNALSLLAVNVATTGNGYYQAGNQTATLAITYVPPGDTTAPTVPTGVTATANSPTQVTVAWNASTDAVGVASYRVRRGGTDVAGATAVTGTSAVLTGLTASTAYSFTVSAVDAAGNRSAESTAATVTTPAAVVPGTLVTDRWSGTALVRRRLDRWNGSALVQEIVMASDGSAQPVSERPYLQAADWLWTPIPASPVIDPNSSAMVNILAASGQDRVINMRDYGVSVVDSGEIDASTPRYEITFTAGWGDPFGTTKMPIPDGTPVPPGTDGHVAVDDPSINKMFNLWQANFSGSTKTASYGAMVDSDGDGRETNGSSTGAGLARMAGVIRVSEMAAGRIPHALFFSTDWCAPSTNFRYPATKSDGNGSGLTGEIPEGTRIQLDPSINIDALSMTAGEKIVAKALQEFGAYCGDNGGSRLGFIAEYEAGTSPGPTYIGLGFAWDYFGLTGIPWSSLRVLANWNGS